MSFGPYLKDLLMQVKAIILLMAGRTLESHYSCYGLQMKVWNSAFLVIQTEGASIE
jgi:hypothetical protein